MIKKVQKKLFVFDVIGSKLFPLNCLSIYNRILVNGTQCIKKQLLRFCISMTETFSNSNAFPLINKYGTGAVVQMSTILVPVSNVAF